MATAFHFLISNRGGAPSADLVGGAGATLAPAPWRKREEMRTESKRRRKVRERRVLGNAEKAGRGVGDHDPPQSVTIGTVRRARQTRAQKIHAANSRPLNAPHRSSQHRPWWNTCSRCAKQNGTAECTNGNQQQMQCPERGREESFWIARRTTETHLFTSCGTAKSLIHEFDIVHFLRRPGLLWRVATSLGG
jgi:hypothetical protein